MSRRSWWRQRDERRKGRSRREKGSRGQADGPKVGHLVSGQIVKITGAVAFVNFGARNEGYIELAEFAEVGEGIKEGDSLTAEIVSTKGGVRLSYRKAQNHQKLESLKKAVNTEEPVTGKVAAVNKGGFEIRFDGVRGFCPSSQFSLKPVSEPAAHVGSNFEFLVTEFTRKGGLVVSRRKWLETKKREAQATLGERIKPGERLQGKVTQIKDFGVFVELEEGLEGLVHVTEISHDRTVQPAQRVQLGDAVEVAVLRVEPEKNRISLSFKQLEADPWADFAGEQKAGASLKGFVTRVQDFGVFVKLSTGIEGLLHVSAIKANERLESAQGTFEIGEEIEVIIDSIDAAKRRIGLLTPEVAQARKPIQVDFKVNDVLKGKVHKVERFGVLLELTDGNIGLIPNAELATERGSDHLRMFPAGQELEVKVLEIDLKKRRIKLSRKALLNHDEEKAFADYKKEAKVPSSLGSFGDLLSQHLKKQGE